MFQSSFNFIEMKQKHEHLKNLAEIRSLMERSSRFISLSGLSGISAGIIALIGSAFAFIFLDFHKRYFNWNEYCQVISQRDTQHTILVLLAIAAIVFILALGSGIFFTTRKAVKNKLPVWDKTTKRLLFHVFVPLFAGGFFCIVLLYHHIYYLIAPATLIFYGLALLNGSKYTLTDVQYLGISEILLGLISSVFTGFGLIFWAIGFGILHIIYGWIMYYKYEKPKMAS